MTLSEYRCKDGDGYEVAGCHYENVEALISTGLLGFCGCGRPDDNLRYIMTGLELIDEGRKAPNIWTLKEQAATKKAWDAWYEGHKEREQIHFKTEEAAYFFWYWADKEGYTEHGGSVPGWLSPEGHDLLALLKEWATIE